MPKKKKTPRKEMEKWVAELMKKCECGKCDDCLHQIALEKEKPNRELFYKQIDAFNKREQFYDHYVEMPDKQIMHIYWHNGIWNYRVFKIEKPTKLER